MSRRVFSAAVVVILTSLCAMPTLSRAADHQIPFDEALAAAKERGVPMVVDFFTDWCVYCKHFDKDFAREESGIGEALDAVVFTSVDAEKGEGVELAKKYGVSGFPTYIVVNSEGELLDRWSGYGGPDHFLGALNPALADPTTVAEKEARFAKNPTANDAQKLAEFAAGDADFAGARKLYRKAEELDASRDLTQDILYSGYMQVRADENFGGDEFIELVNETMDSDSGGGDWMLAVNLANNVGARVEDPDLLIPVLKGAMAAVAEQADFDEGYATRLKVLSLLKLENKGEEAAQLRKTTLKEGWMEDTDQLNAYAWWCFENKVNMAEAEKLARHGIELAESGPQKAMILDTAAEICNELGNCRDSVTLIKQAMANDPDDEHYPEQLERFQKILASAEK